MARAACDTSCSGEDGDGYAADPASCSACSGTYKDCDPGNASINPGAAEILGNGVDEDCDGSTMERHDLLSGMAGGSQADFNYVNGQIWPTSGPQDGVKVQAGQPVSLKYSVTLGTGWTYGQVATTQWAQGSSCVLRATIGTTTTDYALQAGVNAIHLTGSGPGKVLSQFKVLCTAGSTVVDAMLLSNHPAFYATLQDIVLTRWSTMYTPGRQQAPHIARSSPDGDYLMIASQSGFAWTDDLERWHMRNGDGTDLQDTRDLFWSDLLMMDSAFPGPGPSPRIWGINAYPDDYDDAADSPVDGLYYSDDLGRSWELSTDGFWSGIRHSECGDDKYDLSTGPLLVQIPGTPDILALENGDGAEEPDRGLYLHDGTDWMLDFACDAVEGLPKKLGSAVVVTQDSTGDDILVVGFKAVDDPAGRGFDSNTLYACTMPTYGTCAAFHELLGDPGACLPILGEVGSNWEDELPPDVRDIEAEPLGDDQGVIYVADGGKRYFSSTGECKWDFAENDTTVFRVDLSGVDLAAEIAASATSVRAHVTDTDPHGGGEPSWVDIGFWESCYHDDDHHLDPADWYDGDLISLAPGADLGAIVSLALDPLGESLFATMSIDGRQGFGSHYACPTLFRLDADHPMSATWEPMTESVEDDTSDLENRNQRRAVMSVAPDPYGEEPAYEVLPERTIATMAFFGDAAAPDLFLGGYAGWYIPYYTPGSTCVGGWNTTNDVDCVIHELAWGDDVSGWDVYDAHDLAVCHQCGISGTETVDQVATTNGQSARWLAYAEDTTGHREAGDFDCHWNVLSAGAWAQAIWEDPDGISTGRRPAQLWTAFASPSFNTKQRGLLFAEWDDESDPGYDDETIDGVGVATVGWSNRDIGTPCWDGYAYTPATETTPAYSTWGKSFAGTGAWGTQPWEVLECADGLDGSLDYTTVDDIYNRPWYACSAATGNNAYGQVAAGIGFVDALDTVDQDLALALARSPCDEEDTDGDDIKDTTVCTNLTEDETGGGLWLVYHPPTGGALQYLHIPADLTGINPDDDTTTSCVEEYSTDADDHFLADDDGFGTPALQVDRLWFQNPTGVTDEHELRAFIATNSTACGVIEVRALLQYNSSTDTWSVNGTPTFWELDYDGDIGDDGTYDKVKEAAASGCKPFASPWTLDGVKDRHVDVVRGIELTPDGQWLMVFGGDRYTYANYQGTVGVMGVCAVHVGEERADPSTNTYTWPRSAYGGADPNPDTNCVGGYYACAPVAVPYPAEQAVKRDQIWSTAAMVAHPYNQGLFYASVYTDHCQNNTLCDGHVQAPYILQRRVRTADPGYVWGWKSLPTSTLEMPWGASMEWGLAEEDGLEVDRIYHGAAIGGMWEGQLGW